MGDLQPHGTGGVGKGQRHFLKPPGRGPGGQPGGMSEPGGLADSRPAVSDGLGVWGVAGGFRWAYLAAPGGSFAGGAVVPDVGVSAENGAELVVVDGRSVAVVDVSESLDPVSSDGLVELVVVGLLSLGDDIVLGHWHTSPRGHSRRVLLWQHFAKGTDLSRRSAADLEVGAHPLNNTPRKILGWKPPAEAFDKQL